MNLTQQEINQTIYFLKKATLIGEESIILAQLLIKLSKMLESQQQTIRAAEKVVDKPVKEDKK